MLHTIAKYENICNYIHLPIQSGSSRILQLMNRTYTREWYLGKVDEIKEIIPGCGIRADIITGFCTETEADHQDTLSALWKTCKYDYSYMYFYSERPGTLAAKKYTMMIFRKQIKKRRLQAVVDLQNKLSMKVTKDIGKNYKVLVESESSAEARLTGRSQHRKTKWWFFQKRILVINRAIMFGLK